MCSDADSPLLCVSGSPTPCRPRLSLAAGTLLLAAAFGTGMLAQEPRVTPRFYPDDPMRVDDDAAFDASGAAERELSEMYDFLENTFAKPGDDSPGRAVNINTIGEVPDSSWFTNRIGVRGMPIPEIVRGPNKFERLEAAEWMVVAGKGPGGFHPGFRAVHPGDPGQIYQLEVDPPDHPQMATGAELIGTLIYHALGYNVVDVYLVRVDPGKVGISRDATIRDASGERRFTRTDLDAVLRLAARDASGRVYFSATRFEEGEDLGPFRYEGTRPDDPNDIHPHEHRRELRANRVFAAWLAHDDSRAVNTLDLLVDGDERKYIRHYMYDFGATIGSATRFPDSVVSGHEYYIDKDVNLHALLSLGLAPPGYLSARYPDDIPPSAGFFTSTAFEPRRWKPNYPNPAFREMRADDAFWGARLVSRFSDAAIEAIVGQVGYDDPAAAAHVARTLMSRRDAIARAWLNGVNPIVDVQLAPDGSLSFGNAAVAAGVASPGAAYVLGWSRFDNETGVHTRAGAQSRVAAPRATAPESLLEEEYISVEIRGEHPDHAAWRQPVRAYFRRTPEGWQTVGLFRTVPEDLESVPERGRSR